MRTYKDHTLEELENMPTITQGPVDDLKIQTPTERVWLSRCGVEDGEPCNNKVTVEKFVNGKWTEVGRWEAK